MDCLLSLPLLAAARVNPDRRADRTSARGRYSPKFHFTGYATYQDLLESVCCSRFDTDAAQLELPTVTATQ
jgi:hypothetical protein